MTTYTSKTAYLALCALFTAITCICALITVPLGFTPVPVNLGVIGMFLCGGLLGKKYGTISMCVYVFMGAVGVPVFAGFKAGIGVLAGPTGGYIVAYIIGAFIIGLLIEKLGCFLSLIIGLIICYVTGTLWFVLSTGCTAATAITSCVLPFAALDAIKIFVASLLIKRLRPFLYK